MSPGGTADTTAMIMSDLGGGDTTTTTETTAAPVSAPPPSVDPAQIPQGVTDEVDAIPDGEPEPTEAEAQPEVADESQKPEIPNLTETRWKTVHSGYRWAQEVGKALGVVGEDNRVDVTLFPSVEEVKGMRSAYSDRLAMEHDFSSATPDNAKTFIENWNSFSPAGMQTMAANLPEFLAQANPDGYNELAKPVIQRFVDYAYQAAAAEPNPERKGYMQGVARAMEWWATGGYDNGTYRPDQQQPNTPSPIEQRLAASEAQLRNIQAQGADARWGQFTTNVRADIQKEVGADIEKSLASLKPHFQNDVIYQSVRDRFISKLQQALSADAVGRRQYEVAEERAKRTQSPADRAALVALYATQAKRAMHSIRGPFLAEAGKGIKQASDQRHAQLQNGASKTAPTSGGAPRPQSVTAPLQRKQTETTAEFQARMIQADLGLTV